MKANQSLVPTERIEALILMIRGHKVLLDRDLAVLYGVETKALNQAVRRNRDRFPSDFMFQLKAYEVAVHRNIAIRDFDLTRLVSKAWLCCPASYAASKP